MISAEVVSWVSKSDVIVCQFKWDYWKKLIAYEINDWRKHKRSFNTWKKECSAEDWQFLPAKLKKCSYAKRINVQRATWGTYKFDK